MKTNKIMILFFAFALMMVSCKKENTSQPVNNKVDNITNKLLSFKSQLKLKSDAQLPLEEANWYLEGLLNYENANNDHNMPELEYYKDSIYLTVGNGEISLAELNVAYENLTDKLAEFEAAYNDPNSKFDLVNVDFENSGESEIKALIYASSGVPNSGVTYQPGSTDYWYWGGDLGKCSYYQGQGVGEDAADRLQYWMSMPVLQPGYFTDVELKVANPVTQSSLWNDPNYAGPWEPTRIFKAIGEGSLPPPFEQPCLSPSDLQYYLSNFTLVKNTLKPTGKTFKNVCVYPQLSDGDIWVLFHKYYIYYGIFHPNGYEE